MVHVRLGAVAKKLGRSFIGIEREETYAAFARERIAAIDPLAENLIDISRSAKCRAFRSAH